MSSPSAYRTSTPTLESRVFIWSILVEPLMFFVLSDSVTTGIAFTLARTFQVVFGVLFISRLVLREVTWVLPNPTYSLYRIFTLYVIGSVLSSIVGLLFYESYVLTSVYNPEYASNPFSAAIRGPYSRPVFEVIVILYYFLYFSVLPKYLIKSRADFFYLFKYLERTFYVVVFLGFLDLLFFAFFGSNLIPRHLVDSRWVDVGNRFHSIAGEPRDAFPYLLFGLAIIYLKSALFDQPPVSKKIPIAIGLALVLTQSGSGIIGLAFGMILLMIFYFSTSFKRLAIGAIVLVGLSVLLVYMVQFSDRLMNYVNATDGLYDLLSSGSELPLVLYYQASNIYPVWRTLEYLKSLNLFPVIFGFGIGSASFVNNNLGGWGELVNPQSNMIRIVFESGVIGLFVYLMIFISPVRKLVQYLPLDKRKLVFVMFLLLLGANLGHRSPTIFVYLGIVIAVVENWFGTRPSPSMKLSSGAIQRRL